MFSILTSSFHKNLVFILVCLLSCGAGFSQTLQWSKLSEVHSITSMAGIRPNSVIDEEGNIVYVSVEKDILHFYKFDQNGIELAHLNTSQTTGEFTKLIQLSSGNFAIAFDHTPLEIGRTIQILIFNSELQLLDNQELKLPFTSEACILNSIFELDGDIFMSIFNWEEHFIFKILQNGNTDLIFSGAASFASVEKITFLRDLSILIEYQHGTEHMVRRVSIRDKQLIWEKKYLTAGRIEMQYKTVLVNEQWVAMASAERDWVDGQARDTVRLKKIAIEDGSIIMDTFLIPDNHCITHLSDFKFNPKSSRFYFSFAGCFPNYNLSLIELDVDFNFLQSAVHEVDSDELFMHDPAYLHILPNGEIVFAFKSRKDSIERGNLYFTKLKEDLTFGNVLEVNLAPKNSSESISDILTYDDHKILFTGSIPSAEFNIFWEEVQFFTMLLDFESTTYTVDRSSIAPELEVYPNPAGNILYFNNSQDYKQIQIYNISGKLVFQTNHNLANFINVQSLPAGFYTLTFVANSGNVFSGKFLKG